MEAGMSLDLLSRTEQRAPAFGPTQAQILCLTVGNHESRDFARITDAVRAAVLGHGVNTPDRNPSVWLEHGAAALRRADPGLVRSLRRAASLALPVIVVRGLPTEPALPVTPHDGVVNLAASFQAVMNLHAVVACMGLHPVVYAKEAISTLHAVCPLTGAMGQVSSHGFDAALPFHTDYADRPIDEPVRDQSPAAAALAFAVERAEPAVPMECIPTRVLLSRLTPEQIEIGQSEEFAVGAPDIFGGGPAPRARRLFLPDTGTGFRCRLNLGKMAGITARASRLLHEIRDILSDPDLVEKIHVQRGDIVVMDNQRAIHRRAAFTPRWDGADRYLIRMSAAADPRGGLASDPLRPWVWS
jgi:L-asparagine oxygenase